MKMFQQTEDTKMFHKIYLGTILVLVIALIILLIVAFGPGVGQKQEPGPLLVPLLNNVVHNVGVNFESGEPIVIDSLTGEKIDPCGERTDSQDPDKNSQKSETNCNTELRLGPDGVYQLFDTETQKLIPSRIVEAVFVLWEGSSCNTTYIGGTKYVTCHEKEAKCKVLKRRGINHPDCN